MILHTLTATFGCLNNSTLELQEGLNLIQSPQRIRQIHLAGVSPFHALWPAHP